MFLRMKRHASRKDSSVLRFQIRVPRDVAPRVKGRKITVELPASHGASATVVSFTLGVHASGSLHTRDAATADMRRLAVCAHLSKVYDAARSGGTVLSHRQIHEFAGEVYRRIRRENHESPGTARQWAIWKAFTRAAYEGRIGPGDAPEMTLKPRTEEEAAVRVVFGDGVLSLNAVVSDLTTRVNAYDEHQFDATALQERCGRLTMWVLQEHGIEPDEPSYLKLLREVAKAALQAGWQLKREAEGDYRPDPLEGRFPPLRTASSTVTLPGLFDRWRAETKPAASTVTTWRVVVASLRKHLGHEDVARITASDVVAWKDALVAGTLTPRELSAKTINDTYLAGLRALLNYGVSNKLVAENVAAGVKVAAKRRAGDRKLPYDNDELSRLLALCAAETLPARRWIPLLLATSGARVGEVAQLWAERVRTIEGVPCMVLSPAEDGGTFKNEGSERTVPLHPAVIEAGFLDFVAGKGRGPLFYGRSRRRDASRHASKGTANHLAGWIRTQGFTDPRKAPNHALRHWFKTTAPRVGISDSLADAIQGHADATTAGRYRHFALADVAEAVARIPVPKGGVLKS